VLNGAALSARSDGALHWPDRATLVVADLHLEKGSAFARSGQLLPPYDSRATLERVAAAIRALRPARVICLGDSFHDGHAAGRLPDADRAVLARLTRAVDWVWIAGNHDPTPPADMGGRVLGELVDGPLVFRHEAEPGPRSGEVSGHFHPKASVQTRARRLTGRCFVEDGARLILPAFGSYAGGLTVWDPAISGLFPNGFAVHLTARRGVLKVPRARLLRAA
jgi:DNA ligase-associated metallophosphoesterase